MYEISLPDGTTAEAQTFDAAILAAETLLEDVSRWLRENIVIKKDGVFDEHATNAAQQGLLV